jgi:hypothetical protein
MTRNPPDLTVQLNHAISAAVTDVMRAYAAERAGHELPPLAWSLTPSWGLNGHAGAAHRESEVAGVLARWAQVLNLTQFAASPGMVGSVAYTGEVEGRRVLIWGVTDRAAWEQPRTPPPSWDAQVTDAIREVFPPEVAADILDDDAIGPLSYRLKLRCQDSGQSPTDALRDVDAEDRDFCARAEHPAEFLANRLTGGVS